MSDLAKALLFLTWSILMLLFGASIQWQKDRDEAVKSGHAEYYLDNNNNKQWRWK